MKFKFKSRDIKELAEKKDISKTHAHRLLMRSEMVEALNNDKSISDDIKYILAYLIERGNLND